MTTADWARVTRLFGEATARPAAEREAWLRAACEDEPTRREVLALLRAYAEDPEFLEAPADAAPALEALEREAALAVEGRRIGAYRVVREIGRGGMGVVYEARRADADFEQRVAIKLLPAAWAEPALAVRFRFERRVLAGLDHPNIARLLDGGTTEEGVPFFVMEYVEGQPIDEWCDARALDVRARVALVREVCGAVAHAHQQLVVHRDLKPANILVAGDARPRLLDFGIATLVSDENGTSAGRTRTGQVSLTPAYASPEQARGERVTTATDIYSIGVLLYRLLSGQPPYAVNTLSSLDAMRTICEVEPPPPSRVAPSASAAGLRGDLDTIVLKALRKDPRERYVSVSALADDLSAWLDGRPVSAVPATAAYRARKLVARHKAAAAAAAAVLLAIVAGAAATAWQARVAAIERDRAQHRFREVRQFSRSLLFEIHDALRGLPGATEPRRLLLDRAVQFLDGLAADAASDDALALELAEGYRRLGHVQGSAVSENVGDLKAATRSFEKAAALSEAVLTRGAESIEAIAVATGAYDDLAGILMDQGQADAARRADARRRALVEALDRRHASDPRAQAAIASSLLDLGRFRGRLNDHQAARADYARAIAIFEQLPEEQRTEAAIVTSHAFALKRLGAILLAAGELEAGEAQYRRALALDESLVARFPENARYRFDLTFSLSDLAFAAGKRGDTRTAVSLWTRALGIREAALAADPKNVRAMQGVARLHNYLAYAARDERRHEDQVGHWRQEIALRERVVAIVGPLPAPRVALASARAGLASGLLDLAAGTTRGVRRAALLGEARSLLASAQSAADALASQDPAARELAVSIAAERTRAAGL